MSDNPLQDYIDAIERRTGGAVSTSMPGESPHYGFTEQARPEYLRMLDNTLAVLQDPRNAWIGAGPMAALRWTPKAALNSYEMLSKVPGRYPQFLREKLGYTPGGVANLLNELGGGSPPLQLGLNERAHIEELVGEGRGGMGEVLSRMLQGRSPQIVDSTAGRVLMLKSLDPERNMRLGELLRNYAEEGSTAAFAHPDMTSGNAAYGAVGRQVARLLDEILAGKRTLGHGPEPPRPGSFAAYLKEYPINKNLDLATLQTIADRIYERQR